MPRTKHTKEDLAAKLQILRDVNRQAAELYVDDVILNDKRKKYNKHFHPREALIMMAQGASKLELCIELGISKTTIIRWENSYDEFQVAIQLGLEIGEAWWRKQGRENILNPYFNSQLWMMNMSNRYGWTRRVEGAILTIAGKESTELAQLKAAENPDKDTLNGNIGSEEQEKLLNLLIDCGVFEEADFEEVEIPSKRNRLIEAEVD